MEIRSIALIYRPMVDAWVAPSGVCFGSIGPVTGRDRRFGAGSGFRD